LNDDEINLLRNSAEKVKEMNFTLSDII